MSCWAVARQVNGANGSLFQFVVVSKPVTALGSVFSRTSILEISPRFVVVNHCSEPVQVQQSGASLQFDHSCRPTPKCRVSYATSLLSRASHSPQAVSSWVALCPCVLMYVHLFAFVFSQRVCGSGVVRQCPLRQADR